MTAQHPAAPETETAANGLEQLDYGKRQARMAVERIVAERVRVVEGERDALMQQQPFRVAESNRLRAESAEAAHEAEKARVASVVASLTADEPCGEGCRAAEVAALLLGDGED